MTMKGVLLLGSMTIGQVMAQQSLGQQCGFHSKLASNVKRSQFISLPYSLVANN